MSNTILKGIRVVEMGTHVAIPYCSRELADMGAEVIKIETPYGESYRRVGMLFHLPLEAGFNPVFIPYNMNKKSLVLNLKEEMGKEALLKLLETADIFLTNTREMALERLGLSFDVLKEKFPKLVIGSVNGFGTKGRDKDRGGYDLTSFWSPAGMLQEWTYQENPHVFKPFYGFGDSIAAGQLTAGVMSAMYNREKTGKGDVVRVSLLATGLWSNVCGLLRYQAGHEFPKAFCDAAAPLDNFYRTKDGKWFLSAEENWDARCGAYFDLFGTPELKDDPNWNNLMGYMTDIPEKSKFIEEHIAQLTSEEIYDALIKAGAVFDFLLETDDILDNPQAWDNDCLRKVTAKNGKELTVSNIPLRFDSQDLIEEVTIAPELGENSAEILSSLGFSEAQIKDMAEKNATLIG